MKRVSESLRCRCPCTWTSAQSSYSTGSKCKFSHDKNVERKAEKANIYQDQREGKDDEKRQGEFCAAHKAAERTETDRVSCLIDTMDKWDEEKLRSVVTSKGGNPRTTTDVSSSALVLLCA